MQGSDRWIANVVFRSAAAGRLRVAEPSDREIQLNHPGRGFERKSRLRPGLRRDSGENPGFAGPRIHLFRFLPFYRDAFRVIILHKSPDEVSQMNGWNFHTDGVHLNSRVETIVADLVQAFRDEGNAT